jgi:hypothetical protein
MRWDAKITHTAKISVEVRWILIDRVDAILNDLRNLRQRAIDYASPESVAILAAQIPLPNTTKEESEELGGSCSDGFCLLPEVVISDSQDSILNAILGGQNTEGMEEIDAFCGLDETWLQTLDSMVEDLDTLHPLLCWETIYQGPGTRDDAEQGPSFEHLEEECEGTGESDIFWDAEEPGQYLDKANPSWPKHESNSLDTNYAWETNDANSCNLQEETPWTLGFSPKDMSPIRNQTTRAESYTCKQSLLTPLCESIPTQLKAYLDELDASREISLSSFDLSPYEESLQSEYVCQPPDEEKTGYCTVRSAARELLQYLNITYATTYPVDATQLLELQAYMQQVIRFKMYLAKSLIDVRNSLNRREERYRMREANGNITTIMKSHGEGSPLAISTLVDEEWIEDAWSAPVTMEAERVAFQKAAYTMNKVKW